MAVASVSFLVSVTLLSLQVLTDFPKCRQLARVTLDGDCRLKRIINFPHTAVRSTVIRQSVETVWFEGLQSSCLGQFEPQ
jgi:hypothetical protein